MLIFEEISFLQTQHTLNCRDLHSADKPHSSHSGNGGSHNIFRTYWFSPFLEFTRLETHFRMWYNVFKRSVFPLAITEYHETNLNKMRGK